MFLIWSCGCCPSQSKRFGSQLPCQRVLLPLCFPADHSCSPLQNWSAQARRQPWYQGGSEQLAALQLRLITHQLFLTTSQLVVTAASAPGVQQKVDLESHCIMPKKMHALGLCQKGAWQVLKGKEGSLWIETQVDGVSPHPSDQKVLPTIHISYVYASVGRLYALEWRTCKQDHSPAKVQLQSKREPENILVLQCVSFNNMPSAGIRWIHGLITKAVGSSMKKK